MPLERWLDGYSFPDEPDRDQLERVLMAEPFHVRPAELDASLSIARIVAWMQTIDTDTTTKPPGRQPKCPRECEWKAWYLVVTCGFTQDETRDLIVKEAKLAQGRKEQHAAIVTTQGGVSKWVRKVKDYLDAGGGTPSYVRKWSTPEQQMAAETLRDRPVQKPAKGRKPT